MYSNRAASARRVGILNVCSICLCVHVSLCFCSPVLYFVANNAPRIISNSSTSQQKLTFSLMCFYKWTNQYPIRELVVSQSRQNYYRWNCGKGLSYFLSRSRRDNCMAEASQSTQVSEGGKIVARCGWFWQYRVYTIDHLVGNRPDSEYLLLNSALCKDQEYKITSMSCRNVDTVT